MMTRRVTIALAAAGLALAGCSDNSKRVAFDGQFFRAKVSDVDNQRDVFVVAVRDPGKSVEGARAAALHEATAYCVGNYGSSEIVWEVDPTDTSIPARIEGDQLVYRGRCPQAQPL